MNFAFAGGRGDAWAEVAVFLNRLILGVILGVDLGRGQADFTAAFEAGYGIRDGAIDTGLGEVAVVAGEGGLGGVQAGQFPWLTAICSTRFFPFRPEAFWSSPGTMMASARRAWTGIEANFRLAFGFLGRWIAARCGDWPRRLERLRRKMLISRRCTPIHADKGWSRVPFVW